MRRRKKKAELDRRRIPLKSRAFLHRIALSMLTFYGHNVHSCATRAVCSHSLNCMQQAEQMYSAMMFLSRCLRLGEGRCMTRGESGMD